LERAEKMLLMPDLFNYMLTGIEATEYSIAMTTQLMDMKAGIWSDRVRDALGIPGKLFAPIVASGTTVGVISEAIRMELDLPICKVIAVAGHDTQSALAAVPSEHDNFIFISCGTWSLLGTELITPLINEKSNQFNITNEGGYGGKTSFLKNITGLWLIQESRRQWKREGEDYSFSLLEQMASKEEALQCFIDFDAQEFDVSGNIPKRIQEYCIRTGQKVPQRIGEIIRCINESLALKYRLAMEEIISCTGLEYDSIHMVGGGIQSKLLCQLTADACRCKVIAGPVEATVLGNIAVQLIALGEITNLKEARAIIGKSSDITYYVPKDDMEWVKAYERYKTIIHG